MMRKKLLVLITIFVAAVALCSCVSSESVKIGETLTVGGFVEFTPQNVIISDSIYPPRGSSDAAGYVEENPDMTAIAIVATVKNISEEDISIEDICAVKLNGAEDAVIENNYSIDALVEDESKLFSAATIKAGETETLYIYVWQVEKSMLDADTTLDLAFFDNGDESTYTHTLAIDANKPYAESKEVKMGEAIEVEGIGKITLKSVNFADEIKPENQENDYRYYVAEGDGNKLFYLTVDVENLSDASLKGHVFYGVSVKYDEKMYFTGVVSNDADNANIDSNVEIGVGDKRETYALTDIPADAESGPCEIYLYAGGTYYHYTYTK